MPKISRTHYRIVEAERKSFLNNLKPRIQTASYSKSICINKGNSSNNSDNSNFQNFDNSVGSQSNSSDSESDRENVFNLSCSRDNKSGTINSSSETFQSINFYEQLPKWALNHNITHSALSDLLKILQPKYQDLPKDARTLLKTPRNIVTKPIGPGHYFHFGLQNCIENLLLNYPNFDIKCNEIEVFINIDGLPLSKSSSSQVYPILCSLVESPTSVDIIGIYHGFEKPINVNAFLEEFVDEVILLMERQVKIGDCFYRLKIKGFICDVPAKAFILCTKGHAGYYSCSKCDIEGNYSKGRVCFPSFTFNLRTDESFRKKSQEEHHNSVSILENIPNLNMIRDFPLDPMHLVYLGVVKKLILIWCNGIPPMKLSFNGIQKVSALLLSLRADIPCDFNRLPRSLNESKRWKATEYRQFILYTGPVVLKSVLNKNMYVNFLSLHVALIILSSSKLKQMHMNYAKSLLSYFVKTFIDIYGKENVSHNIHNLLHICDDAEYFGTLEEYSAFAFENYMQSLLKLLRKKSKPLEQIVLRKAEFKQRKKYCDVVNFFEFSVQYFNGPTLNFLNCTQFKHATFKGFSLKLNNTDNFCCLKNGGVIIIKNFIIHDTVKYIIGSRFKKLHDFYSLPCPSSSLGIYLVNIEDEGPLQVWNAVDIDYKCLRLQLSRTAFVIFPLVHLSSLNL